MMVYVDSLDPVNQKFSFWEENRNPSLYILRRSINGSAKHYDHNNVFW